MSEGRVEVHHGDMRQALAMMAAASFDACVTDPPYGLSFMGKDWDKDVPGPEYWRAVFRVLKPGAHLVAFFGTRTYHRGVTAIEAAGFEIRDQLAWLYGSGFPKIGYIDKALDALDPGATRRERSLRFTAWIRLKGLSAKRINLLTGTVMGSHFTTAKEQPAVATADLFDLLRPHLGEVPDWVEQLVAWRTAEAENLKRRQVVGEHEKPAHAAEWRGAYTGAAVQPAGLITEAHTDLAKAWEGWAGALKPALEPVVMARKPLEGTLAENVARHGCGALNIDGCRVEMSDRDAEVINTMGGYGRAGWKGSPGVALSGSVDGSLNDRPTASAAHPAGRWPANLIHDGTGEVVKAFPADEEGSAARFFYSAKADAGDRLGSKHPTVKPIDLMAWLVRLVTPGGGRVLDPFAGTGTTGIAALREGLSAVLVELEAESVAQIRLRLEHLAGRAPLTGALKARRKPQAASPGPLFGEAAGDE